MNCPLCVDAVLRPSYRRGVEIDVCERCRGVWLDRGELDKVLGDERGTAPSMPPPPPGSAVSGRVATTAGSGEPERVDRPTKSNESKKSKKSKGARLADLLEEVLDL